MPSRKVSMRASMANQTSHLGIMGGLAKGRTSGASGNRATNKLVIPRGAAKGLAYMQMHGILSRNPQSGGVGKVVKSKPCNCKGLGKTEVEGDLGGGDLGGGGGGCSAGTFSVLGTTDPNCVVCLANYYCPGGPTAFVDSLVACPSGTTSLPGGKAIEFCTACSAGQTSDGKGGPCTNCTAGQTSDGKGGPCTNCTAGQTSDGKGGPCTNCTAGQTSNAGDASCTACLAGYFSNAGDATCTPCPPGKYSDTSGAALCAPCPIGTYTDEGAAAVCSDCSNGTTLYVAREGVELWELAYVKTGANWCSGSRGVVGYPEKCYNKTHQLFPDPAFIGGDGSTTQGYFCCASGNDGLFQLSGTPDCSGIGVGSGNSNLCRLTGPIAPGACSKPSCNAVLGCSSLDNESGAAPGTWHPGAGEECSADATSNQRDVAGCIWDAAAQSGHCPSTSCWGSDNGGCYVNPNPTIPSPAMVGCSSLDDDDQTYVPGSKNTACSTGMENTSGCTQDGKTCPATACYWIGSGAGGDVGAPACKLNPYLPYICSDKACVAQIVDQSTVVQPVMSLEMCKKNCPS